MYFVLFKNKPHFRVAYLNQQLKLNYYTPETTVNPTATKVSPKKLAGTFSIPVNDSV